MNRYMNMVRLIIRSILEWDEVYLTHKGRVITGAEWDVRLQWDEDRLRVCDEMLVGSCWVARLHMDVDDE